MFKKRKIMKIQNVQTVENNYTEFSNKIKLKLIIYNI